jgi:hypothetical protein
MHPALQSTEGGTPMQLTLQRAPQLALHDPSHSDWFASDAHWPMQWPSQSALHEPWQSNMPGCAEQLPLQLALQLASQFTSSEVVQPPLQLASRSAEHWSWKLGGVHIAMHPPEVTSMHCSLPAKSKLPQPGTMSARASPGVSATAVPATREAIPTKSPKRRGM